MVIMAVFGGPGTVFGPVIGAFILSAIYEYLSSSISTAAALAVRHCHRARGVFMPRGLIDLAGGLRRDGLALFPAECPGAPPMSAAARSLLEARGLTRRFQGLVSVDNVSFTLASKARFSAWSAPTAPARRR